MTVKVYLRSTFFRYPVPMKVPFRCVIIVYEAMQNATSPERAYNPLGHAISGGVSGTLSDAAFTIPHT